MQSPLLPRSAQAPDEPTKVDLWSVMAVKVSGTRWPNSAEQVLPQSMPAGSETMVPVPVPDFSTVTVTGLYSSGP